jgi:hypothetical protein
VEVRLQTNTEVTESEVYRELGKLHEQTKDLREEIENSDDSKEAAIGFLEIVGKALRRIFSL